MQIPAFLQINDNIAIAGVSGGKTLHKGKHMQGKQHDESNQNAAFHKSDSYCQPDRGAGPESSRCR